MIKMVIIEGKSPTIDKLKMKIYEDPITGEDVCDLLYKRPKTWGSMYGEVPKKLMREMLMKNYGINMDKIKQERYVWGRRKNGKFGWIKQKNKIEGLMKYD